jgi:hypothetical protein
MNAKMEKVIKSKNGKSYLHFIPPPKANALSAARLQTQMLNRLETTFSFFDPSQKVYAVV